MGYTDPTGKMFGFRIFRTRIINDSIIPVELTINFPCDSVAMLPKSDSYVRVFLFPRSMTPDEQEEVFNYGVRGTESFLDTGLTKPTALKTTIKSKEDYILYIGALFYPTAGRTIAKLFFNGQDLEYRIKVYGAHPPLSATDLALDSALLSCGQIVFKK